MNMDMSMSNLSVALLHHPVYNKHRQVVTTAFTNLDIHDIARTSRTFGLNRYYLVTPSLEQQQLLQRVVNHWDNGWGATYNPDRREALSIVKVAASLAAAVDDLQQESGKKPITIATGAAERSGSLSFHTLRERLQQPDKQYLLLLGTGWGLTNELFEQVDCILEPIRGPGEYNHLPVRSALAIMLDRLMSAPHH